ncbi:hypothetical protein [Nodularia chucula]
MLISAICVYLELYHVRLIGYDYHNHVNPPRKGYGVHTNIRLVPP